MRAGWIAVCAASIAFGITGGVNGGDIENPPNKAWVVRYAEGHGNRGHGHKPDYDAARLEIKLDGGKLTGKLWLYEIKKVSGIKQYVSLPITGGFIDLEQQGNKGGSGKHKRQEVRLKGTYVNANTSQEHDIRLGAVLHTLQAGMGTGRNLDRLAIRIFHKRSNVNADAANKACDQQAAPQAEIVPDPCDAVPDVDILEEGTSAPPELAEPPVGP